MKTFYKTPLAIAITALMVAPYAFADFDTDGDIESDFTNEIDVDIEYDSDTEKDFDVDIEVDDFSSRYAGATVDSKQLIDGNEVENVASENNATMSGSSGSGASGNVGINVAAGDNNAQANDAALAASDAADVFGQAAAFSAQSASNNFVNNYGTPNTAGLSGSSLSGASGNIAVNVAAGVYNAQQNSLAAAVNNSSGNADATTGGVQMAYDNTTNNLPHMREEVQAVAVNANFTMDASGLEMDQIGNVYPDIWDEGTNQHPTTGSRWGHVDLDDQVQGAQDLNDDGGALAFRGTSDSMLSGTITGQLPAVVTVYEFHSNDASLAGSALSGASGNIGVNVAAGSNNLQRNSLSIAAATNGGMPDMPGNGNGGGE